MWLWKSYLRRVWFCGSSACTLPPCFIFKGNTVHAGSLLIATCWLGTTPDPTPTPGSGGQQPSPFAALPPPQPRYSAPSIFHVGVPAQGLALLWSICCVAGLRKASLAHPCPFHTPLPRFRCQSSWASSSAFCLPASEPTWLWCCSLAPRHNTPAIPHHWAFARLVLPASFLLAPPQAHLKYALGALFFCP